MAVHNRLTEEKFDMVKTLLKGGAKAAKVSEYVGLSTHTIYIIGKSDSFQDYQKKVADRIEKKAQRASGTDTETEIPAEGEPKVIEHRQTITVQATHYMMVELQKTNELLAGISAKLAFLVEQLS